MRNAGQRASRRFVLLVLPILLAGGLAFAENIDPLNNGSQYAWAENLGWINLQPNGPGGDGVQVSDTGLTGWAWGENAGWISFSCQNTSSCGTNAYGVTNDRCGNLAGHAWSANAGWINFAPNGAGVGISGTSGIFYGRAWSANAGWISFSGPAGEPFPWPAATSWRLSCDDNNTCTDDSCSPGTGCVHAAKANGTTCDDGNACTQTDTCSTGTCIGSDTVTCAPPDQCHNPGTCVPATGVCTDPAKPDGTACDDGNTCSVSDSCHSGLCFGSCYCAESGGGVAGWWPGDATANDISGGGRNGTLMNGATFGTGKFLQAFSLDGVDDFVQVPGYLNAMPVSEVTVVFWQRAYSAKIQSTFSQAASVSGAVFNAHVPYVNGTVYWDFGNIGTGGRLSYTPPVSLVGTWQHFALVASQSGNYMRIFRNGVLEAAKTGMTPFVRANVDLAIGGAPGLSFGGQIDEFAIYSRALSAPEIRVQYDAGAQGVCRQCTDPDGDGYGLLGDTCHNGNLQDCAASDATVWQVPGEATSLLAASKVLLTWSPPAAPGTTAALAYDVVRGSTAAFPVGLGGVLSPDESCFDNLSAPSVSDSTIPASGAGFWYLSRGENTCGNGTYGTQGVHGTPGAPRITTICP